MTRCGMAVFSSVPRSLHLAMPRTGAQSLSSPSLFSKVWPNETVLAGEALREALVCPDTGVLKQDVRRTEGESGVQNRRSVVGIPHRPSAVNKSSWCNLTGSSGRSPGYYTDRKDVGPHFQEVSFERNKISIPDRVTHSRTYRNSLFELQGILNLNIEPDLLIL